MMEHRSNAGELSLYHVAELAALVSTGGPRLVRGRGQLPETALHEYWAATRQLHQRWMPLLSRSAARLEMAPGTFTPRDWAELHPVLEEVFVTDLLVRLWTAILSAAEHTQAELRSEAIGRSVLITQMQARHEALRILLACPPHLSGGSERADRLRRRTERWTDMLLGNLQAFFDVSEFAFDAERAVEFGSDASARYLSSSGLHGWKCLKAALSLSFRATLAPQLPLGPEYRGLYRSILASFPAEGFAASGPLKSLLAWKVAQSSLLPEGPPPAKRSLPANGNGPARPAEAPERTAGYLPRTPRFSFD